MQRSLWTGPLRETSRAGSGNATRLFAVALAALLSCSLAASAAADHHEIGEATSSSTDDVPVAAGGVSAEGDSLREHGEVEETAGDPDAAVRHMSLADAIALGIENNLAVEIARHEPLIAEASLDVAWSAYDPLISGDFIYSKDGQPSTNQLSGQAFDIFDLIGGGVGGTWDVPVVGANVGLRYNGSRSDSNGIFSSLRPQYDSNITFDATVPLAKNLIWNQQWTSVKTSRIELGQSRRSFADSLMDTVAFIENSYWSLVATGEQLRVAEKSLESASALLDMVNTQYEVGVVSKVDVIEAEAGVAERDFSLIEADNAYHHAQDTLIDAVLGTELSATTDLIIAPTDSPDDFVRRKADTKISVEKAFARRPDLKNAKDDLARERLQLGHKRNQMLPQLDFKGSYSTTGRGGIGAVTPNIGPGGGVNINPTTATSIGDTNDDFFTSRGGEVYTLGGVISIPLGNLKARKEATIAEINVRKANTKLTQLKQSIILEVRDTVRNLASSLEGIDAAERRRAAAAEQLRAERVRLEHGESTPFDVLQRERDLVEGESQKIAALQTYRISETNLLRSQGTLLESRNIVLEDAAPLRPAHNRW